MKDKKTVGKEKLDNFYRKKVFRQYSTDDMIKALLGVAGAPSVADIKACWETCESELATKKSEVDAKSTDAEVDTLLGGLKY